MTWSLLDLLDFSGPVHSAAAQSKKAQLRSVPADNKSMKVHNVQLQKGFLSFWAVG